MLPILFEKVFYSPNCGLVILNLCYCWVMFLPVLLSRTFIMKIFWILLCFFCIYWDDRGFLSLSPLISFIIFIGILYNCICCTIQHFLDKANLIFMDDRLCFSFKIYFDTVYFHYIISLPSTPPFPTPSKNPKQTVNKKWKWKQIKS